MQLTRILEAGVPVVIVTGRGKSVGADLRGACLDRRIWAKASVGYYNGAAAGSAPLQDEQAPVRGVPSGDLLGTGGIHFAEQGLPKTRRVGRPAVLS